jgi:hypothetical protein
LGPRPPRLLCELETAPTTSPDELDWHPVGGQSHPPTFSDFLNRAATPTPDGDAFKWCVSLKLPTPAPKPLRVTIRELELEPSDGEFSDGVVRIVYADRATLT